MQTKPILIVRTPHNLGKAYKDVLLNNLIKSQVSNDYHIVDLPCDVKRIEFEIVK